MIYLFKTIQGTIFEENIMPIKMLREFFLLESAGGILLVIAAVIAILISNSPLENYYHAISNAPVLVQLGNFSIDKDFHHWINDGLMAIFFLLVSLEIKREVLDGQLSSRSQISLPAIAAFGGLVVPSLIYLSINWGNSTAIQGWAIPAATDIAFALGVLTLLGSRVPESLKLTLVAIAIIDDLAAILIIAVFYTEELSLLPLGGALLCVLVLLALNQRKVSELSPYMAIGTVLWMCVLKSGLHATLAGVVVAMLIPHKSNNELKPAPLYRLEHGLHLWVAFLILPLFAIANAGVSLKGLALDFFVEPVTLGVGLGLLLGKPIGVTLFTYIGARFKFCSLPEGINWSQFYGLALLAGIGFTMSLFIGGLAFEDEKFQTLVRLGVITASLVSGILGYFTLRMGSTKQIAN